MLLSDISVKRPVFASVISLLLIAFGLVSFDRLSLREYPDIDPPIVTVEVNYPGAPANVVETRITQLIEERVAGIAGIESIESSSRDGRSQVTMEFSVNRDVNEAANDVRDRVAAIQDNLPETASSPEVQKVDSNDDVVIWQNLSSAQMTVPELTDYANRYLVDQYSALDGVARIRVGGGLSYALRIWLDSTALTARNMTTTDIENALRENNIEFPAGSLQSDQRLFKARVIRHFEEPKNFESLILRQDSDGSTVRLGDVARIEKGVEEDRIIFRGNGIPMVGIGVIKQSTANTLDVSNQTKVLTEDINKTLPKGMTISQSYDSAVFIRASIEEVFKTLFIAIICVVGVIYLFLGSIRAMLIPAITVPISLIASFVVIYAFGFSINLLTLLALVLAIGLIVDDAIVMLENIVRRIQEKNETPLVATYRGARQVGFAVIATTLVLIAVFVPITFLEGDTGKLFTEFALTISAAVLFSSLVALTLVPALASKILVPNNSGSSSKNILLRGMDRIISWLRTTYLTTLTITICKPFTVFCLFIMLLVGTFWLFSTTTQEFTPKEDRGAFFVMVTAPKGSSFDYINGYMTTIEQRLMPYVDNGEVKRLLIRAPRGFGNIESFDSGFVIVLLSDWSVRRSAFTIINEVRQELSDLPGVRAFPVMRQGLGGGTGKPVQVVLGGSTYEELASWRDIIISKVQENNLGFEGLDSNYKENRPQLDFTIKDNRAADLGVSTLEIGKTLETLLSGKRVTTYFDNGEEYDVILEGERDQQNTLSDILGMHVRSHRTGELIPLSSLIDIHEYGAAETLTRYNRVRSITLEANLKDGYSLGDSLTHMEMLVREYLPEEAQLSYKGPSLDYMNSENSMIFVFLLGLAVVFLVLAAQFESYIHPTIIMVTVPLATGGGLLGLYVCGSSLNIYSQIGLIMLVGLAAKNGILIIEFANQLRDKGIEFQQALLQASDTRFRPILMTGLTTIAGTIPLIISSGAGAETRISIGVVVLFGVLFSTILTLYIVPTAYNLIARNTGSPNAIADQLTKELDNERIE